MKFKKRLIAFLLIPVISITVIMNSIYTAYAISPEIVIGILGLLGSTGSMVQSAEQDSVYSNWYDANIDKMRDSWANCMQALGMPSVLTDKLKNVAMMDPIQDVRRWMVKNTPGSNPTDDEVKEQIYNMYKDCVILENGDFKFSSDFNSFLQDECDYFIDQNKYYVGYSLDLQYYPVPDYFKDFIKLKQDTNYLFARDAYNGSGNGLRYEIYVVPKDLIEFGFVYFDGYYNENGQNHQICTNAYDALTFQSFGLLNNSNVEVYNVSCGPSSSGYGQVNNGGFSSRNIHFLSFLDNVYDLRYVDFNFGSRSNQNGCIRISCEKIYSEIIFGSYGLFTSNQRGKCPYYINESVYYDWRQSRGDYVVTNDNSNHVSYGDVNTFIDDHHSEIGTYPGIPEIYKWIEDQPIRTIPTPTPGPGGESSGSGTSGSGGTATATANNEGVNVTINNNHTINFPDWFRSDTVSGNSVSGNSSGEGSGISFGFLGTLGQTLKSLIENIGKAIVDIITGISSVIAEIVTNIPTVFGDFVGAVLGWLPPELQALISLSVIAMITYGLIKLIRG